LNSSAIEEEEDEGEEEDKEEEETCRKTAGFFLRQYHHMSLMDFVVSPLGCGRSVTDVYGWDAHEAQLRCPDEVDGDI
jgi:hypothetical protein